ncbi:MAG: Asp-tRNA(Asn)/Glu-tRNA(Gln) amidotransferase subunit GatA [Firmicutes bacterium]|nr:Asp-tRNA(Asn)/Glu-tRNA(Gln) amidotransferase subunit GatA [Bacillota bacterium]
MELLDLTALQLGQKIKSGEIGVREAAAASISRIRAAEPAVHSFVSFNEEAALTRADEIQKKIDAGELSSPLAGVPMAVKDNICTKGVATTCSSRMLENFVPTYSANAWHLLENAGAVMLGKTNLDEFAMGSTTETSYFGATRNPWDPSRVPGGSSGGSAAAVAAGEAFYTLGSDTGGSIRQPAAFCGVTGIKPTYGSVSRYGLVAFASSLDQIGPIGRDAADCAAVLAEIMKHDRRDSTSVPTAAPGLSAVQNGSVKGMKIGIPKNFYGEGLDSEVRDTILKAAEQFRAMGAELEEFEMPIVKYAVPTYYILATAEASSNLARYDGVKYGYRAKDYADLAELYTKTRSEGFGMEVKRRILLGCFVLSSGYYDAYYLKALKVRALIKQAFDRAFEKYDMILAPTAPTTAYKIGENTGDPLKLYLGDIYTAMINIVGLPALTAPCGFDAKGLPVGMQLIGRPFGEEVLLTAACAYQRETDFHRRRPSAFLKGGDAQ